MRKLFCLLAILASIAGTQAQSVGVGTTVPDSTAVLDIFSSSKGVLIPRILDTATVAKPTEGLIIYNKATKSPYYFNGTQWRSLGSTLPQANASSTDHITYQVSGAGFTGTEEPVFSLSQGVSNPTTITPSGLIPSQANLSAFNFMKQMDINSIVFNRSSILGVKFPSIEIKLYATPTATVPYASYRLQNIIIESYQVSGSAGGGPVMESVSIAFENFGFKDWVNNQEFGYNLVSKSISSY